MISTICKRTPIIAVEAFAGSNIDDVLAELKDLSVAYGSPVAIKFNDVWLVVEENSDLKEVKRTYWVAKPKAHDELHEIVRRAVECNALGKHLREAALAALDQSNGGKVAR